MAEKLLQSGARVTLLLGPAQDSCPLNKNLRLLRFKFFDELLNLVKRELAKKCYDIVIHSAAVSDYRPKFLFQKKVRSNKKHWSLGLIGTPKIIGLIKKIDKSVFLVGFKYEPRADRVSIARKSRDLLKKTGADLVIGNTIYNGRYRAYIVNSNSSFGPFLSKEGMVKNLVEKIGLSEWAN